MHENEAMLSAHMLEWLFVGRTRNGFSLFTSVAEMDFNFLGSDRRITSI